MLSHGDELGRTQHGNNNAYCHDGPLTWVHWDLDADQRALLAFTRPGPGPPRGDSGAAPADVLSDRRRRTATA